MNIRSALVWQSLMCTCSHPTFHVTFDISCPISLLCHHPHSSHTPAGVSIEKFHEMKAESAGQSPLLTPEQQQWLTLQRMLANTRLEVSGMMCDDMP